MEKLYKERDSYWDNLKGVLIVLVVCGHLCERYISDSDLLEHIWILIYSFHMPLFIFVNGYFARKSSKQPEQKCLKMLGYYLLMQVLFMLGNYLIKGEELKISILADPEYCCWYLLFMVYAYLSMKFLPKESDKVVKWIIISIVLSLLIGFDASVGHSYAVGRTFYFLPYFFLGVLWADKERVRHPSYKKKIICAASGILIFAVLWELGNTDWFNRRIFSGHQSYERLYPGHLFFAFVNKAAAYIIAVLLAYIILNLIPRKKTFFCFFGRHTLLIYLVHIFVLPMEFYLIKGIDFVPEKELNSVIILLILVATSAIICCMIVVFFRLVIVSLIKRVKRSS